MEILRYLNTALSLNSLPPSKPFDDEGDEYDDEYDNPNKDANRPHAENETAGDHASLTQTNNGSGDNAKKSVK